MTVCALDAVRSTKLPPRKKRERTVPICAGCGRALPKLSDDHGPGNRQLSNANQRKAVGFDRKKGVTDDKQTFTADGMPPERGPYGDNLVCSQVCGHVLAVRLVAALGLDVLAVLPPQWRHR